MKTMIKISGNRKMELKHSEVYNKILREVKNMKG
jgi:hypothetical protein